MIGKLVTIFYLISLAATVGVACRYRLHIENMLLVKKVLAVLSGGYCLALVFIFINNHGWKNPLLFVAMLSFYPFILFISFLFQKYEYRGDLSVLIIAIILNSLGLIALYRLDINSNLPQFLGYKETVPMAFKQLTFSMIALFVVTIGISKGLFSSVIEKIEKCKNYLYWGGGAIVLLAFPKLTGSMLMSQDKSFQTTEFAFKIMFLIYIAMYFKSHASELVVQKYPMRDVAKLVLFVCISLAIFFFLPMCYFQKELGTSLLVALTFIILTSYVTNRLSFFVVGVGLIALAIFVSTFIFDHVAQRIFATWLDWKDYAFKSFDGGEQFPGYQIFTAIAAIKLSPWGVGMGNGILKHTNMDSTIVPKAVNDFIAIPIVSEFGLLALLIIGFAFFVLLHKAVSNNDSLTIKTILAVGITIALTVQALYNLSSVIALLPPTGVPLPWLSYGGSATLANYMLIGLLTVILNEKEECRLEKK